MTGDGVPPLIKFISLLQNRDDQNQLLQSPDDPVQFDINENFMVSGVGLVISGLVKAGTIKAGIQLLLGPDKSNQYKPISIKSIHVNRVHADEAVAGEFACIAIKSLGKKEVNMLTRDDFRKGMVALDPSLKPISCWQFEAEVMILHHATTIEKGYQAVVHCGVVRQAVKIVNMSKDVMRTNDEAIVRFQFLYTPEFVKPNGPILLREGRTKISGRVTKTFPNKSDDDD